MLRPRQPAELFGRHAFPAGDIADQLLENPQRSLAAAIVNGLGNIDPSSAGIERGDHTGAEQVANVGNGPVVAVFDERVFPKSIRIPPQQSGLLREDVDDAAQYSGVIRNGVLIAIKRRDQLPDLFGVIGLEEIVSCSRHANPPPRSR